MTAGALLVGLGQISMGYDLDLDPKRYVYSHARALSQHPDFELLGGVDCVADRRETFSHNYRRPAFANLSQALIELEPELVVIAVPTDAHLTVLNQVLEVSLPEAILCEKPLSYDIHEARTMVDRCADKGVNLYVNYIRRSNPAVIEIRNRIDAGELRKPLKGMVWYSKGLVHNGSHFINLLEFWMGSLIKSTTLSGGRFWDGKDPEPDLFLEFENGSVTMQAAWEEAFSHYTVELLSPSGRLRYETGGLHVLWQSACVDKNLAEYRALARKPHVIESGMERYQHHVAEQLAQAIAGKKANICSGIEALGTLESILKIVGEA